MNDRNAAAISRRHVVRGALGSLAMPLLPACAEAAVGQAPASAHGAIVSPDPIKPKIQKSGLAVGLADFSRPPTTAGSRPLALLNTLYHAGDGSHRIFTNDSRGVLWQLNPTTGAAQPFLDVRQARGSAFLPGTLQMGLRSFAFHPDFAKPGAAGFGKLYTATTETVASRPAGVKVFDNPAPYTVIHDGVVAEWSVDPKNPSQVDPTSRRELFRVTQYKSDHQLDQLLFNPNNVPGGKGYGKLFVTIGDGGNVPVHPDPFNLAQNTGSAHGKVFRIDPLKQADGSPYGVPRDNPFVGHAGFLPEIWALGLRHPLNLSVDRGGVGAMILTDIGQHYVEEVNFLVKGGNYGWPKREGTFVTNRTNEDSALRPGGGRRAERPHLPGGAVRPRRRREPGGALGDLRRLRLPRLGGAGPGGAVPLRRPRGGPHLPRAGRQPQARLAGDGPGAHPRPRRHTVTLFDLVGTSSVDGRVDLRFGEDEAGEMYVMTKQDGVVRRIVAA